MTCTNKGNPGYDLLVARKLGLPDTTERVLLHGAGLCWRSGHLRASQRNLHVALRPEASKAARILALACELCTPNVRHDLAEGRGVRGPGRAEHCWAYCSRTALLRLFSATRMA